MKRGISRRLVLGGVLSAIAGAGWARAPERSLRPVARPLRADATAARTAASGADLIRASGLSGKVSYAVADAATGLKLEANDDRADLPPASVAKAVTALYALETLGPGHRFVTRLIITGGVANGVLSGDLVLTGGGDPTLDTDALAALAGRLRAAGITRVAGKFLVYGGALPYVKSIDPDQPDHVGYSPSISGLSLNYNRVHFEWKRTGQGYAISMEARSETRRPQVRMAGMAIIDRSLPVYTYRDQNGRDMWTVARQALNKFGSRWLPVRKPEVYAGEAFRELARSEGTTLPEPRIARSLPGGQEIARHQSESLQTLVRAMLKYSTNITAEMVGLAATKARRGKATSLASSAREMSGWAGRKLGMTSLKLVDHSGLGDASRMRAGEMAQALVRAHQAGLLPPLLKPIALRDEKGRPIKKHPIKVFAKTGTLNFVSGLAGYLSTPDGTVLAFAITAADTRMRSRIKRGDKERPQGARGWNRRAKALQQQLIERWAAIYGA